MTRQQLLDRVGEIFRRYIGPGRRGKPSKPINEVLLLLTHATNAQLESFLSLDEFTMSLGPGITPHSTGHKGSLLDYWSDAARSTGAYFGAIAIITHREHAGRIHLYFDELELDEAISLSGIPDEPWGFTDHRGGVPQVWIMPTEENVESVKPLLRLSYNRSLAQ